MRVTFRKERAGFGNRNLPGCSFLISSEASVWGPRIKGKFPPLYFAPRCSASQILRNSKNSPIFHTLDGFLFDWYIFFNLAKFAGAGCASSGKERRVKQRKCAFGDWPHIHIFLHKRKNINKKYDFFFPLEGMKKDSDSAEWPEFHNRSRNKTRPPCHAGKQKITSAKCLKLWDLHCWSYDKKACI